MRRKSCPGGDVSWSAAGWSHGMAGLGLRRWCWMRLYIICIDNLSCKAQPITAARGLRVKRVDVCRKLEGLIVGGFKVLVKLHRKSGPRSTSTGRSHDVVLLHGELRWGSKWYCQIISSVVQ